MRAGRYSVEALTVPPGTEVRPGVRSWARFILRAETAAGDHTTARAVDTLDDLRRRVRLLRRFGFLRTPEPAAAYVLAQTYRSGRPPVLLAPGCYSEGEALLLSSVPVPALPVEGVEGLGPVLPGVVEVDPAATLLRDLRRGEAVDAVRVLSRTESA